MASLGSGENGRVRGPIRYAQSGDVSVAYPDYGPTHGYSVTFSPALAPGSTVCAYAINVGAGSTNPQLGCRTV